MKKRILISLAALFVALGVSSQTQVNVKVAEGILAGTDSSGVKIFKGVPFAAPPVGNLRWREPQPVACWQGVRDATKFGPNPMQERVFGDMNFGTKKMSEDCLYLNIWTPAKTMKEGSCRAHILQRRRTDSRQWQRAAICRTSTGAQGSHSRHSQLP